MHGNDGIARGARYARSQARNRGGRIEWGMRFLRQYANEGAAGLGGGIRIGRNQVGQNSWRDAQGRKNRSMNLGPDLVARQ